jgi:hypothetical protein
VNVEDTCGSSTPNDETGGFTGIVWVNFTLTNDGQSGTRNVWARVYQGIEDYANCPGNFSQSIKQEITMSVGGTRNVSVMFVGINCSSTGITCYGNNWWIENQD